MKAVEGCFAKEGIKGDCWSCPVWSECPTGSYALDFSGEMISPGGIVAYVGENDPEMAVLFCDKPRGKCSIC